MNIDRIQLRNFASLVSTTIEIQPRTANGDVDSSCLGLYRFNSKEKPKVDLNAVDYIYPQFRGLSKIVAIRRDDVIDLTLPGVVESSVPLLMGKTMYRNHNDWVGNEVGVIVECFYEEPYKLNGQQIPGGINFTAKIPISASRQTCEFLSMDPPAINANSVDLMIAWEQSHPDMSRDSFIKALGYKDAKGNPYKRMVVEILDYPSTSLVSAGQDPYAKLLDSEGRITNPEESARQPGAALKYGLDNNEPTYGKVYSFNYHKLSTLGKEPYISEPEVEPIVKLVEDTLKNETIKNMNEQEVQILLARLGLPKAEANVTFDQLSEVFLSASNKSNQDLVSLRNQVIDLTRERDAYKAKSDLDLVSLKDEAIKNYKLAHDDIPESTLSIINSSTSTESLSALNDSYLKLVESKMPLTCNKCNSTSVSRGKSSNDSSESIPDDGKNEHTQEKFSNESYLNTFNLK